MKTNKKKKNKHRKIVLLARSNLILEKYIYIKYVKAKTRTEISHEKLLLFSNKTEKILQPKKKK